LIQAQRWHVRDVKWFMIVFGLISTVFDVVTFMVLLRGFRADQPTFQTAWFLESLLTTLAVLLVLRTRGPAFRSRPSRMLLWMTVAVACIGFVFPYSGPLAAALGFVPMPFHLVATMVGIVGIYILTVEVTKAWFYRRFDHKPPPASS
jgi:Mg2+-importing ATPase